jgi:tetratricopeptide (TPR) repeat protein
MSDGYSALKQQQYEQAINAFTKAGKINPQAQDAKQALVQAQNKDLQIKITHHFTEAQNLESQEQWQQAYDHYEQIQTLDPSVLKGKIGAIRTQARAKLDSQLESHINQPARLAEAKILNQAKAAYRDAQRIKKPGQRLNKQIQLLNDVIIAVQNPISVQFKSNNQTQVTLYRVAKLGHFSAKQIDLRPGKYTLVGTRVGYRDVRQEFTLSPGKTAPTIVVQCEEKISNG